MGGCGRVGVEESWVRSGEGLIHREDVLSTYIVDLSTIWSGYWGTGSGALAGGQGLSDVHDVPSESRV